MRAGMDRVRRKPTRCPIRFVGNVQMDRARRASGDCERAGGVQGRNMARVHYPGKAQARTLLHALLNRVVWQGLFAVAATQRSRSSAS
jgi:hypothetical protein